MVPEIRFSGFTDPWEQRKLGETCQVTMGQSPNGSTYSEIPSKYILVQGNADSVSYTHLITVNTEVAEKLGINPDIFADFGKVLTVETTGK